MGLDVAHNPELPRLELVVVSNAELAELPGTGRRTTWLWCLLVGRRRHMGGIERSGSGRAVCAAGEAARRMVPHPFLRRKDNGCFARVQSILHRKAKNPNDKTSLFSPHLYDTIEVKRGPYHAGAETECKR